MKYKKYNIIIAIGFGVQKPVIRLVTVFHIVIITLIHVSSLDY